MNDLFMDSFVIITTSSTLLGLLSLCSSELTSLVDGSGGKTDVLFRANSNHVAGNGDKLLSNGDVSLSNKNSSVMDSAGKLSLSNECLESSLHELREGQTQDVIELSFSLLEKTKSNHSSDKSITYNRFIILY